MANFNKTDFYIAVTGNREIADLEFVKGQICIFFDKVKSKLSKRQTGAGINIIGLTPLAEGADQVFAQCLLDSSYKYEVVLPFSEPLYKSMFKKGTNFFDEYINKASRVHSFPYHINEDITEEMLYKNMGEYLVDIADIVLVIWDGKEGKQGGTEKIKEYAINANKPVYIIFCDNSKKIEKANFSLTGAKKKKRKYSRWFKGFLSHSQQKDNLTVTNVLEYADRKAIRYRDVYKNLANIALFLALLASAAAICSLYYANYHHFFEIAELAVLSLVVIIIIVIMSAKFHKTWAENRAIAEYCRTLDLRKKSGLSDCNYIFKYCFPFCDWKIMLLNKLLSDTRMPASQTINKEGLLNYIDKQIGHQEDKYNKSHKHIGRIHRYASFIFCSAYLILLVKFFFGHRIPPEYIPLLSIIVLLTPPAILFFESIFKYIPHEVNANAASRRKKNLGWYKKSFALMYLNEDLLKQYEIFEKQLVEDEQSWHKSWVEKELSVSV